MLHDFDQSLRRSQAQADAPWWPLVYRKAFVGYESATYVGKDGWQQRHGIDRIVRLKSGKEFLIDEKVRYQDWPDIALERWSDRDRGVPGWVQKPTLYCDYIAYAFVPSQRCYLFPYPLLRLAWTREKREWCELAEQELGGFCVRLSENEDRVTGRRWTTENICVPIDVLLSSLRLSMIIDWGEK